MPIALTLGSQSVSIRQLGRSIDDGPNQALPHANLRALHRHSQTASRFSVKKIRKKIRKHSRSRKTANGGRFRDAATPRTPFPSAPSPRNHEIVRTRSRQRPHQSLQNSLGDGPRTTCRPHFTLNVPTSYRAPDVLSLLRARSRYSRRRKYSRTRSMSPSVVGAPRWPKASAWEAGRPQRGARGRPPCLRRLTRGAPPSKMARRLEIRTRNP
jgi:hypothetical protein